MSALGLLGAVLAAGAALAGDAEKERIKRFRFEIQPIEFHAPRGANPFMPLLPMRAAVKQNAAEWKLRIVSLKLSSVIAGRRKVAVFKESMGPGYPYLLVDGVLLGPDRKPVPGVAGSIEPAGRPGAWAVTLRQGADSIEFTQVDALEDEKAAARSGAGKTAAGAQREAQGGYP